MKRIWCLLLSLCLCVALCVPALAWPQNYAECWDYVSWVRDGSLDERDNPFEADKKITMLGWDIENEVPTSNEENYEYVASDTSWTVKNTGTGNYYFWINCSYCPRMENGSYSGEWGASLRENGSFMDEAMDDEEEGYKVKQLYPGESVTFSFSQFIDPYEGDKGNGEYVYSLHIHMEFPEENDARATLSKNFMWNEAEAGGGQTPGGATIVQRGTCGDNLTWTLDDTGKLTISGAGAMKDSTYNGPAPWYANRDDIQTADISSGVTSVGSMAFYACRDLTSVTIPDGVTRIGRSAFSGCTGLTSLTIPDGVTSIEDNAFSGCTGLTSITIPDSLTSIGSYAFSGCTGLTSITIPDGLTTIGSYAFSGCTGLTSIMIPDSVTSIGDNAFENCAGLTSLTISDGVTSIGSMAFSACTGLTSITIPDSVTSIGSMAFSTCTGLTSLEIPDSVTSIGNGVAFGCTGLTAFTIPSCMTASIIDSTFAGCTGLTSITIPDGVTSIGNSAFSGCTGLTAITIPPSVSSIGFRAFERCSGLTSITIPDGVVSLGYATFSECSGLTSITIPSSVTSIGGWAFDRCPSLTDVYYSGTETQWNAVTIESNNWPLRDARIHYNSSGPEPTPAYAFPSTPTVSGGAAITRANVGTLTEITVPVAYSGDTAQTVTFAVPFYDGSGKFIGVGMKTETVTSSTQSVAVPVSGLSGSESMKVMILGDTFNPLSLAGSYNIPA